MKALVAIALLLAVSCTQKEKDRILVVPADEPEADASTTPNQNKVRAEKLVNSAEELLSPIGFMLADQILDQALKNDPTNRKAQFYKAAISPLMKMRGALVRLAPLRNLMPRLYSDMTTTNGALGDFLRDRSAGPELKTEADLQILLSEIQAEQKKVTDFIARNRGFVTRISVSHVHNFDKMIRACMVSKISKNTYRLSPCPFMQQLKLRMNRGDWEAFYQMSLGSRMVGAAGLSYNLEGALAFHGLQLKKREEEVKFTAKDKSDFLADKVNTGKLLPNHQLDIIRDKSVDTYTGMKWLLDAQSQLCNRASMRAEHVLPRICLSETVSVGPATIVPGSALDLLRMSIGGNGGTVDAVKNPKRNDLPTQVRMDILAPAKFPIEDLKSLLPRTFDSCGNVASLSDPTFGGLFPGADAEKFFVRNPKFGCVRAQ